MTSAEKQSVVSLLVNIANRLESRVKFLHFRSTTQQELDMQGEMKSKFLQMAIETHVNHQKRTDAIIETWLNSAETELAALAQSGAGDTVDCLRDVHARFRAVFLGEPPQAIVRQVTHGDDLDVLSLQAFASFLETEAVTLGILTEANKLELAVSRRRAGLRDMQADFQSKHIDGPAIHAATAGPNDYIFRNDFEACNRIMAESSARRSAEDALRREEGAYQKAKTDLYLKVEEALPHLEILADLSQFIAQTTLENLHMDSPAQQMLHLIVLDGLSYTNSAIGALAEKATIGMNGFIPKEAQFDLRQFASNIRK